MSKRLHAKHFYDHRKHVIKQEIMCTAPGTIINLFLISNMSVNNCAFNNGDIRRDSSIDNS